MTDPTLDAISSRLQMSRLALRQMCDGTRKFRMSIPVQKDDTDIVLDATFTDLEETLDRLAAAQLAACDAGKETL